MSIRNLVDAVPLPVIEVDAKNRIRSANTAAEQLLGAGRERLRERTLPEWLPPGSPLMLLVDHVRDHGGSVTEYGIDLSTGRTKSDQLVDVYAAPLGENAGDLVLVLQPRAIMDKMNRHLTHRDAVRSVGAMASMLAHEIKNPLSGIRGAAQLLEGSLPEVEKPLSTLIRSEVDRIVRLVERFEVFSDGRPLPLSPVNIHEVLDHVMRLAQSGFGRRISFRPDFDPIAADHRRQSRSPHPGRAEPREERRGSHRARPSRGSHPHDDSLPARRLGAGALERPARLAPLRSLRDRQWPGHSRKPDAASV